MRIVTDGKFYAIEKGWIFKRYLSFYSSNWYNLTDSHGICWTYSKESAENRLKLYKNRKNLKKVK